MSIQSYNESTGKPNIGEDMLLPYVFQVVCSIGHFTRRMSRWQTGHRRALPNVVGLAKRNGPIQTQYEYSRAGYANARNFFRCEVRRAAAYGMQRRPVTKG